jgi:hypothetical protein
MKKKLQLQKALKNMNLAATAEPVIQMYPHYVAIAEKNPVNLFTFFDKKSASFPTLRN